MGICGSYAASLTSAEKEVLKHERLKNKALDTEIIKAQDVDIDVHKLLLLGAGESGKLCNRKFIYFIKLQLY